jgi:RNA polymerase sigma-54 factor
MKLRQNQNVNIAPKNKLSAVLRNWLPILQSGLSDLEKTLKDFSPENPFVEITTGNVETNFTSFQNSINQKFKNSDNSRYTSQIIEAMHVKEQTLTEHLEFQINSKIFPTPISEKVALKIIANINHHGYFELDEDLEKTLERIQKELKSEQNLDVSIKMIESIRQRFSMLDPAGVGAINTIESFKFQLKNISSDLNDEVYELILKMIDDFQELHDFKKEKFFIEAKNILHSFQVPPAIDFFEDSPIVIPDLIIMYSDETDGIQVQINDPYYPVLNINTSILDEINGKKRGEFISSKLKEAKQIVDALNMRKATIYKVGLMILEYQYDFFIGGSLKPLTLQVLADEFGHNVSTISRAISDKFILCDRGIFPMKNFFSNAVEKDISSEFVKEQVFDVIKKENHIKPLSDIKILGIIKERFKDKIESGELKLGRRTITKYRQQLGIESSNRRKRTYILNDK